MMFGRSLIAAVLGLALGAAPAQAGFLGYETPRSPNAEDIAVTFWVMFVVVFVIGALVLGPLVMALIRFRERREARVARVTAGRGVMARVAAGLGVVALAIVVFGIVMTVRVRDLESSGPGGLSALGAQTAQVGVEGYAPPSALAETGSDEAGATPSAGAPLEIDAVAQQWLWRFEYPTRAAEGLTFNPVFSYGELVVPVDTTVVLNINSTDVMHTWWVPALGGQVRAVPGKVTTTWFKAEDEGRYEGRSTTFSGTAFPAVRAWVKVVSPTEYQQYVEQLGADLEDAQAAVQERVSAGSARAAQQAGGGGPQEAGE
jgi:cytochrome c oxidase subunit II